MNASVRSILAVSTSPLSTPSSLSPSSSSSSLGAFCRINFTWNSGDRLRSLSGCNSSTSFSNGSSWRPYAPRHTSFTVPVRDVGPDHRLLLPAVPAHHHHERPHQRHKQRHSLPTAQRFELLRQFSLHHKPPSRAPATLARRSRMISRQLHLLHPSQLPTPIRKLLLQRLPLQPRPLPGREIRVLDRQLLERRLGPRAVRLVKLSHFSDQDSYRPPVAHDVVHREEHHVPILAEFERLHPDQWPFAQIEPSPGLLPERLPDLFLFPFIAQAGQVFHLQRARRPVLDHLYGPALFHLDPGPEDLVPSDDLFAASRQALGAAPPFPPHRPRAVVRAARQRGAGAKRQRDRPKARGPQDQDRGGRGPACAGDRGLGASLFGGRRPRRLASGREGRSRQENYQAGGG